MMLMNTVAHVYQDRYMGYFSEAWIQNHYNNCEKWNIVIKIRRTIFIIELLIDSGFVSGMFISYIIICECFGEEYNSATT